MTEPRVFPSEFIVTSLADDDVNSKVWRLVVTWRGGDRWAVTHMGSCLRRDGSWDYEPMPSSRSKRYLVEHRFSREEAIRLAIEQYPKLIVNGLWVRDGKVVPAS